MTYEECVNSALLAPQFWGFFLFGLVVGVGMAGFDRWYYAVAAVFSGAILGAAFAMPFHELNCVELYPS